METVQELPVRLLCSTVYVMDNKKRFLMLHHRKLNKWVPPGGKVDRHETPDEAAIRECFEETGVAIMLANKPTPVSGGLPCPFGCELNAIKPGLDHVDLIYLGKPQDTTALTISEREAHDIGWFTLEEVMALDTFDSVREWCTFFYSL